MQQKSEGKPTVIMILKMCYVVLFYFLNKFYFESLTLKNKSKSNSRKIEIKANLSQMPQIVPGTLWVLNKYLLNECKPPQEQKL